MACFPFRRPDVRSAGLVALLALVTACSEGAAPVPATPAAVRRTGPAPQPVRGVVHTVRMLLDEEGYRFDPGYLTVREGDGVRFVMISGVPHNVAFDEEFIPAPGRAQLVANLTLVRGRDLAAPVITAVDSSVVVSTSGLPHGEYLFYCAPHRSLNMHGVLTVR
jgi:plastocyanin